MTTFRRGDIDPLEVSCDRIYRQLAALAERAWGADKDSLLMISAARSSAEDGDDFATKQFMRTATKRDKLCRVLLQELGMRLALLGYGDGSTVAVGRIAVSVPTGCSAVLLGTVSDVPPEVSAALDAALEGDSEPDWTQDDELAERMYHYAQMISLN